MLFLGVVVDFFIGSSDIDGEKREGDRRRDREEVVEET